MTRDLDPRPTPSAEELTAWMSEWIARKLRAPAGSVGPESDFTELGLDSLVAVELSGKLEELLGRPIDPSVAWDYPTVGALAAALGATAPAQAVA
jgi:acyl carrier protein